MDVNLFWAADKQHTIFITGKQFDITAKNSLASRFLKLCVFIFKLFSLESPFLCHLFIQTKNRGSSWLCLEHHWYATQSLRVESPEGFEELWELFWRRVFFPSLWKKNNIVGTNMWFLTCILKSSGLVFSKIRVLSEEWGICRIFCRVCWGRGKWLWNSLWLLTHWESCDNVTQLFKRNGWNTFLTALISFQFREQVVKETVERLEQKLYEKLVHHHQPADFGESSVAAAPQSPAGSGSQGDWDWLMSCCSCQAPIVGVRYQCR